MNAKRLRIGIDAHVVTGRFQGTRTTLTRLLQALARRAPPHDVFIYSEDPVVAKSSIGDSNFRHEKIEQGGGIKRLLKIFPRIFQRDHIDVGIFQYNTPLLSKTKNIVFIHDILPMTHPQFFPIVNRIRIWIFFSISIARSSLVVTVSEYTRQQVLRFYRLAPNRVLTILNGPSFNPACYNLPRLKPANPYVLAVGRIEERKNIHLLVDAFHKTNVEANLIVVGAFDLGFKYEFPNDSRIESRKGLGDLSLIELYRGASLFVYPSAAEGFGLPLLDAMLFGVPTIASCLTAMEEIAGNMIETFDPTDPSACDWLAARITSHFAEKPVAALDTVQRTALAGRFNWDNAADRLIKAVETVAI
ncbi:glycosyltransferase family 1 protein [Sphingomonas sp. VNH70]|uniref:glycosyltransferase family 4 protein n=1 Tax=Sphingomonas silueang TaxID=3156617 RepID=UPI0032B44123